MNTNLIPPTKERGTPPEKPRWNPFSRQEFHWNQINGHSWNKWEHQSRISIQTLLDQLTPKNIKVCWANVDQCVITFLNLICLDQNVQDYHTLPKLARDTLYKIHLSVRVVRGA